MIVPKSKVLEAVARCLAIDHDHDLDAAIESVAQAMHLTANTVRECVQTQGDAA